MIEDNSVGKEEWETFMEYFKNEMKYINKDETLDKEIEIMEYIIEHIDTMKPIPLSAMKFKARKSGGASMKRIQKEWKDIQKNPSEHFTANPVGDLSTWEATINGPKNSPYEGGVFKMDVVFPSDYPFKPIRCRFVTKVYHPNVKQGNGAFSLEVLGDSWSPALTLQKILLSVCSLLSDPNPDNPFEVDVAQEFQKDRKKYEETAREWTQKYAVVKSSN